MANAAVSPALSASNAPPPSPFTMKAPAAVSPLLASQTVPEDANDPRKYGLLAMAPGSQHRLTIAGVPGLWTAKDRGVHHAAKGFYFCTGCDRAGGEYRSFATKTEMVAAHPAHEQMRRNKEIHLFGFYSNDIVKGEDGREGAIGLLSGDEPTAS